MYIIYKFVQAEGSKTKMKAQKNISTSLHYLI